MKGKIIGLIFIVMVILVSGCIQQNSYVNDINGCHPDNTDEEIMRNFDRICKESGGEWYPPCVEAVVDLGRPCNMCICPDDKICDSRKGCI